MAELPELVVIARQIAEKFEGKRIEKAEARQPKCLNLPQADFEQGLTGAAVSGVTSRGKWLRLDLDNGRSLLVNFGMGAAVRYRAPGEPRPEKHQLRLEMDDGSALTVRFSWFGHLHLVPTDELFAHRPTAGLGPDALSPEVTPDFLAGLCRRSPTVAIRRLLLDQKRVSGIGNGYVHDILFEARINPARPAGDLSPAETARLHAAIGTVLRRAAEMGGMDQDLYGQSPNGGDPEAWGVFMLVGWKEGRPCPACGTPITKARVGSLAVFLCEKCQGEMVG